MHKSARLVDRPRALDSKWNLRFGRDGQGVQGDLLQRFEDGGLKILVHQMADPDDSALGVHQK